MRALGREPREVLEGPNYLAVYEGEAEIRAIAPDMELLKTVDGLGGSMRSSSLSVEGSYGARTWRTGSGFPRKRCATRKASSMYESGADLARAIVTADRH